MPQSSKHVEQMAPELEKIVSPSEPIHDLADGFGGAHGPAEGPLWWKEGRYLLFSDIHNNRRINDSRRGHIRAFDLMPNGTLAKQTDRVFVDLGGSEPGVPDGMKVDVEGNVYCGGAGGLWIMDPHGKKLGRIVHGAPATTNLAFGGDDWKTLYFTSRNHLGAINVKIPGVPVPPQKK
jgi:sugar lactone lactonase YvrE